MLRPRAREHIADLITEFEHETEPGLRRWLLELIGDAQDERALPLLARQLGSPDEALRSRAITGVEKLAPRTPATSCIRKEPTARTAYLACRRDPSVAYPLFHAVLRSRYPSSRFRASSPRPGRRWNQPRNSPVAPDSAAHVPSLPDRPYAAR